MSDLAERLISPISNLELERRWSAVRAAMAERGIDVLVMQNSNEFSGGYVKWFTDMPAGNGTMTTVIVPKDDLMTVVAPGPFGVDVNPPAGDPVRRGVKRFLASPNFMGASFTTALDNANVEKALEEFSGATIGLVAQGSMGHALADHLKRGKLGNATFVDATDLVDAIMVIKSDEEIAAIRATALLQDRAMRAAFEAVRPGIRDIEITAVAEYCTRVAGAEYGLLMGASSPIGQAVMIQPRHLQNRVIREGDQFVLLVETTGPGGFFCELGRTCVLGKATQSMKDEFAFAFEAQQYTAVDAEAGRRLRRHLERLQRFHGQERPPEGEPALLPRPGLSPGREAAGALRRSDADRGGHEHRGAPDVSLQGYVYVDLRQFPRWRERRRAAAHVPAGDCGAGVELSPSVVPAQAGTHTPCHGDVARARCDVESSVRFLLSSPRRRGPIRRVMAMWRGGETSNAQWLWVPAFAGTTATEAAFSNHFTSPSRHLADR